MKYLPENYYNGTIKLKLLCVNKTDTLEKLNVDGAAADGFEVPFDLVTGGLTLTPNNTPNIPNAVVTVKLTVR